MAKQYLINFLIRGHADAIEFEVRENDWLRAQDLFEFAESTDCSARFLILDTVEGLAVAISLSDLQLVRFLCHSVEFPSDQKHKEEDVLVWLRGREKPIRTSTDEEKDSLSAFFILLDSGAEHLQFPGFTDVDGELTLFNTQEVALVTAPLHEVREGHQLFIRDGEFDNKVDLGDIGDSEDIPF